MATGFEYLMQDFGNWNPNLPSAEADQNYDLPEWNWPPYGFTPPIARDAEDVEISPTSFDYWGGDPGAAAQNWGAVIVPMMQLMSNNEQFRAEFQEAQNRFWEQFGWSQERDRFNMRLATRQQSAQEWQAAAQQRNFEEQLADQRVNDAVARDVAQREIGLAESAQDIQSTQWQQSFEAQERNDAHARIIADQRLRFEQDRSERELSLAERRQIWDEEYGKARLELDRESARFAAFGRATTPNARWVANWG